jgi:hypothetical protein
MYTKNGLVASQLARCLAEIKPWNHTHLCRIQSLLLSHQYEDNWVGILANDEMMMFWLNDCIVHGLLLFSPISTH